MKNHNTKSDVYGYVLNRLADDAKNDLERHMSVCEPCRKVVTYNLNKLSKNEACNTVRSLFPGFQEETITRAEMRKVRDHKMACDGCEKAFRIFLRKNECVKSVKRLQSMPDVSSITNTMSSDFITSMSERYREKTLKEKKQLALNKSEKVTLKKNFSFPIQVSSRKKKGA